MREYGHFLTLGDHLGLDTDDFFLLIDEPLFDRAHQDAGYAEIGADLVRGVDRSGIAEGFGDDQHEA